MADLPSLAFEDLWWLS